MQKRDPNRHPFRNFSMNYYSYPRSCLTFGLFAPEHIRRKGSLSVDRAILIFIKTYMLCGLRVVRTATDNNNTRFKVQNVSHVSPRENRTHAGWRASTDESRSRGINGSLVSGAASLQRSPSCTKKRREKGDRPQKQCEMDR